MKHCLKPLEAEIKQIVHLQRDGMLNRQNAAC